MSLSPERLLQLASQVARQYTIHGHDHDDLTQEAAIVIWKASRRRTDEGFLIDKARARLQELGAKARQVPDGFSLGSGDRTDKDKTDANERRAMPLVLPLGGGDPPARPDRSAEQARELLLSLIQELPPKQFLLMELQWRHHLGTDEIAATMGITHAAVRRLRYRAHENLKKLSPNRDTLP